MKLKLDKNYLKISAYVIFTLVCSYSLFKVVDSAAYIVTNMRTILDGVGGIIGSVFSVFSVLITAFIIAYLLDPVVDFFQAKFEVFNITYLKPFIEDRFKWIERIRKRKEKKIVFKKRTAGAALTYLSIFLILAGIISFTTAKVGEKIDSNGGVGVIESISYSINATVSELMEFYESAHVTMEEWDIAEYLSDFVTDIFLALRTMMTEFSKNLLPKITSAGSMIVNFLMSMVIAFYFLVDKHSIKNKIDDLIDIFLSDKIEKRIKNVFGDIHAVFSGYIRGQLTDAAIMGVLLSLGLSLVGVEFAVLIGVFSGFANIIPYFGAIVGFLLSIIVALLSGEPTKAVYAGIVVIILQQIDGIFIVPKIVGEKVELGPALVLLSLSIAGGLFGIVGMIFAVPTCAIIKIFLSRFIQRHKRNKLEKEREIKFKESMNESEPV